MRVKISLMLIMLFSSITMLAQQRTISGIVSEESGGIPGVSILIKGTNKGTETDFDGKYSIKANTGDVLVFSYIGYTTVEKIVGNSDTINVTLVAGEVLDEIIVVGYGTSTKQAYTGTAKVVKAETLESKSVANVTQALIGEVAGVNVINTSGQPGTTATVRIRGFGSVNGNRSPLYVVDGIPLDDSINSINPSDIESTTILKDATATAIYGSRGANGVILITTKKGKAGATSIDLDFKTGVNFRNLPRYSTITDPDEYLELSWKALYNNAQANRSLTPGLDASNALFNTAQSGIDPYYNYYNVPGNQVIDPTTGKINSSATRKFTPENWADYAFQPSIRTEANIKFSGGSDKTRYFSSFGYLDDQGYIVNSKYRRIATRLNLEHKPKDWLKANVNLSYTNGITHNNGQSSDSGSIFLFVDNIPSMYGLFLRDANGNRIPDVFGGFLYDYGKPADTDGDGVPDTGAPRAFLGSTNGLADANYDLSEIERHSLSGNFSFDVTFNDNLSFSTKYGAQIYSFVDDSMRNPFYGTGAPSNGTLFKQNRSLLSQNFLNMFKFNKSFGDHNLTVLLAHESNQYKRQRSYISRTNIVNLFEGRDDPGNYVSEGSLFGLNPGYTERENLESYFTQVSYNYLNKYYFSGSLRRDGSSVFKNNKWGTFGSAGVSWIVSKEDFMDKASFVNYLKVKASYGIIGDKNAPNIFTGRNGYNIENSGDANNPISLILRNGDNIDLTWEQSKVFQTGIEFTLFDNKIEGSLDYYNKITDDMFFTQSQSPSIGFTTKNVNDGQLKNSGIEFEVTSHLINKADYKLDFSVNGEMLNNEILKMPSLSDGSQQVIDQAFEFGRARGHSIFDIHVRDWAGVDPSDGFGMWYRNYDDKNNNNAFDPGEGVGSVLLDYLNNNPNANIKETITKVYSEATQRFIGKSSIPKIRGAFRLNAKIHNFTIGTQFTYSLGGYSVDYAYASLMDYNVVGNNNYHTDVRNAWQQPGDISNIPRLHANYSKGGANSNDFNRLSSRFVVKSDFLALNNLNVGYGIPSKFLKDSSFSSVNFNLSADNLFVISARDGFNPASSEDGSTSVYRYPPLTTITLGVKVKF